MAGVYWPEFARIAPDIVTGSCPPLLQDFIEVRGLGLLNVRRMFGDTAIKRGKYLRLIVHLAQFNDSELAGMDRLAGVTTSRTVLGLKIPQVTVPIAPGRNMAVLVETAVRHYLLRLQGYDASEDFIERQRNADQVQSQRSQQCPGAKCHEERHRPLAGPPYRHGQGAQWQGTGADDPHHKGAECDVFHQLTSEQVVNMRSLGLWLRP